MFTPENRERLPDDWFFQVMNRLSDIKAIQRDIEHISQKMDQMSQSNLSETEAIKEKIGVELKDLKHRVEALEKRGYMSDGYKEQVSHLIKKISILLGLAGTIVAAILWFAEKINA